MSLRPGVTPIKAKRHCCFIMTSSNEMDMIKQRIQNKEWALFDNSTRGLFPKYCVLPDGEPITEGHLIRFYDNSEYPVKNYEDTQLHPDFVWKQIKEDTQDSGETGHYIVPEQDMKKLREILEEIDELHLLDNVQFVSKQ